MPGRGFTLLEQAFLSLNTPTGFFPPQQKHPITSGCYKEDGEEIIEELRRNSTAFFSTTQACSNITEDELGD